MQRVRHQHTAAAAVVGFAVLLGSLPSATAARPHGGRDSTAFTEHLSGLLQAAQMNLARAEAHHEKEVKRARRDTKALFLREARSLGEAVGRYSSELAASEDELRTAVDAARASAKSVAEKDSGSGWASPAMEARARLAAQTESAARLLRAAERKHGRLVREAEVKAERTLEDIGERLSRRVGDLTPEVDEAKSSMQAEEHATTHTGANASAGAATPPQGKGEPMLKEAEARSRDAAAAAEKHLGAALAHADGELQAGVRGAEARLQAAEREEIKGVRGAASPDSTKRRPPVPPPAHSHRA